jgi:hypothetical protein
MNRIFWLLALGSSIVWAMPSLAAPSGKVLCYALANNATAPVNMPYTPDSRSAFSIAWAVLAKGRAFELTRTDDAGGPA